MVRCWVAGLFGQVRGRLTILCGVFRDSFFMRRPLNVTVYLSCFVFF